MNPDIEDMNVRTRPFERVAQRSQPAALGSYWLHERLGAGAVACVYRARRIGDPDGRDVAIKRLHPHLAHDTTAIASFVREVRIAYLLDHPVIRRALSLCRNGSELFIVMEYIEGKSLFALLKRASALRAWLSLGGVLAVLHQLCDALDYAHELLDEHGAPAGFVHRDISPSNLIATASGKLKLIDMGVARTCAADLGTRSGLIKGKYGYMAPEVLDNQPFDRRADVYSVGVVAWEMLTLHKLFRVRDPPVDLSRVRSRPIDPPSIHHPTCPAELDAIVLRALANDPTDRWPTCAAMASALRSVAAQLDEPLSDKAIAALTDVFDTTSVVTRLPHPLVRPRLARGTPVDAMLPRPPALAEPSPSRPIAPAAPATAFQPRRRWVVVAGALVVVLVMLAGAIIAFYQTGAPAATADAATETAHERLRPRAAARFANDAGASDARPAIDARPAMEATPPVRIDASDILTVTPAEVTRLRGPWPRSRSGEYAYTARLCIDSNGGVTSASLLEGPRRLQARILWALRRWRYQPYLRQGRPRPVCFELVSRVGKLAR